MENEKEKNQGKISRWKFRRGKKTAPFASDKEGHYDLDGVSYSKGNGSVVVASDLSSRCRQAERD